ncbi:hypothetical protein BH20BAC1_BH20BAC1_06580 [soil metagenome]
MVLEIKVPHGTSPKELLPLLPVFMSYVLSFVNIAIYWNNHHHMMQTVKHVNGKVLWANVHLLFWLSLIPFASGWMGENRFEKYPIIFYGFVLLMAGVAYYFLAKSLIELHGKDSAIGKATKNSKKEIYSVIIYLLGIGLSFYSSLSRVCIICCSRMHVVYSGHTNGKNDG